MDEIDAANDRAENELARMIDAARRKAHLSLPGIGKCLNCEEQWSDGRRFCNAECRDDYQRMTK
jgi:hypothetical protein